MSTSAVDVVRAYFAAWPAKDRMAAESLVADDVTFTSPLDNRLNRTTFFARCCGANTPQSQCYFRDELRRYAKAAGSAHVNPHALRHTFATRYLQGGGDIYVGATGFEPATPCAQGPRPATIRDFLQQRTSKSLIHRWIWRCDPLFGGFLIVRPKLMGCRPRCGAGWRLGAWKRAAWHRLGAKGEARNPRVKIFDVG